MQAPNADVRIRPARPDDVPAVLDMVRQLAEYEELSHACIATEEQLRHWLFELPVVETIVAEVGVKTAGFALFFTTFSTFVGKPGLYIEDLFVLPGIRGKGVGKRLLVHIAQLANSRGYGRVEWSVLKNNMPAIHFYDSLGGEPLVDWQMYRLSGDELTKFGLV